ncbi:carbon monoxide dehydrogenase [bacterium M00.F.Ca.ET.228.01.1.1]|uniref:CoxG family protein n=1 Tax=Paraburkholderia phenoliruptrix TaxID=252970 RepID=UPI001092B64E|nr:carbon monoxide dehydrogenase subunit G [Paraburkholderia phenoliruptrix]MBW9130928.1 carbon monoxide dehydrogenase subunit G [Paraburkholderia ginsengiterrae]TGP44815.1 carbon monoxide dehydrogenase [bacterium M00.F.Ca.ET.228.01.1.1]TGS02698.1 carbon monoxide dehydrogenase [bacterium M00.F.Ca.ET.191.01.1.1]TGU06080.1 carbon monoxide dehydrogenase [bacterium M00.F.Ca.ET.155.01.1.1]MBW0448057.1 carbon monoxide dehydrogenase subunit G [Paraburkholderia phenoliruptrix]
MELTETHTLPVSQQRTWEALNDTEILRACIPGCESIDPDGENAYLVVLSAAVGPVKARFKGRMQLTDIDAPNAYNIVFEGQGGAAGFAKGNARVTLEADGDASTKLSYTASAQVGGKLAQIGSRLVDGAARKIAGEFFKRFGAQFGASDGADAARAGDADDAADGGGTAADGAAGHNTASTEAADNESGGDATKRKKSWTAWISKS